MGKIRDLFKKIRDTKGTFHARMSTIKDRNGMDLTEAEDIKKRWQEYMEELYKKDLHDQDNHDGVITHLESDILECEVKWALTSITTNKGSRGDRIPGCDGPCRSVAEWSYPSLKVRGGDRDCQTASTQEQPRGATPSPTPGVAA